MSYRTLIEINHDVLHEIDRDPEGFIRALKERCSHLHSNLDASSKPFGLKRVATRHHSQAYLVNELNEGFPAEMLEDDGRRYTPRGTE